MSVDLLAAIVGGGGALLVLIVDFCCPAPRGTRR
jgi:hypothetical protein